MWKEGIRLDEATTNLKLLRENDCFIMERLAAQGYSAEKLARLNRCRCHLQVVTLADITDGRGRAIASTAWTGQRDMSRPSQYVWPIQPSPPRRDWEEWQAALALTFRLDKRRGLPQAYALGRWYHGASEPAAIEVPEEERVYVREEGDRWRIYSKARGRRSRLGAFQYSKTDATVAAPPDNGLWASAWRKCDDLLTLSGSAAALEPTAATPPSSFLERLETTASNIRWAVENCRVDDDGSYVAQAIRDGTAIAVSDGSFKDAIGAAGFVLEGHKYAKHRVLGDCMVTCSDFLWVTPNKSFDKSSFRRPSAKFC